MYSGYTEKGEAHRKMTDDEIRLNLESLHASTHELFEAVQRHDKYLERLTADAQSLHASTHELNEAVQRHDKHLERLITIAADALQSVQSLERIATAHQQSLDEHDGRIERLEDGK